MTPAVDNLTTRRAPNLCCTYSLLPALAQHGPQPAAQETLTRNFKGIQLHPKKMATAVKRYMGVLAAPGPKREGAGEGRGEAAGRAPRGRGPGGARTH